MIFYHRLTDKLYSDEVYMIIPINHIVMTPYLNKPNSPENIAKYKIWFYNKLKTSPKFNTYIKQWCKIYQENDRLDIYAEYVLLTRPTWVDVIKEYIINHS